MDINILMDRQNILQEEADEILSTINLFPYLKIAGNPVQVGSYALGLMVWRDIDITVICPKLDINKIAEIKTKIMQLKGVKQTTFKSCIGAWNANPNRYPDSLYLGITYEPVAGKEWNFDIWFIDEPSKQPDLIHIHDIPRMLDDEKLISIMRIKTEWVEKPEYRKTVTSYDIYKAVLNQNIKTVVEFAEWLKIK